MADNIFSLGNQRFADCTFQPKDRPMQQFARLHSVRWDAFARTTGDRTSLSGAVIRLVTVFVCAGTAQVLAGWLLR